MRLISFALIGAVVMLAGACTDRPAPEARAAETPKLTTLDIPRSIRAEHEEIHSTLVEATRAEGAVGEAARALAAVLDPHFVREEQIALPPLGLLSSLAAGASLSEAVQSHALAMSDSLKAELPRMLQEHAGIRAAVGSLRAAAQSAGATRFEQLFRLFHQPAEDVGEIDHRRVERAAAVRGAW